MQYSMQVGTGEGTAGRGGVVAALALLFSVFRGSGGTSRGLLPSPCVPRLRGLHT